MKAWKLAVSALGAAMVLAACGGGGGGETSTNAVGFTSMVNFGDSLSDVGSYKVGTIAAVGGGKWTVNSDSAKNWTELVAAQYNLPAPCAAQTGLFSILPGIPAVPVQNIAACTSYAQGSSRVTNPAAPSSYAIQQAVFTATLTATGSTTLAGQAAAQAAGLGVMATPVVTQMANHLTKAGGSYSGKELITVMAGGNDIFMNLNGVSSALAGGATAVGAARFAGWSPAVQGSVAGGGATATSAAAQAAVAGMTQAATELVAAINTQLLEKGAKYVAVVNLPDVVQTPFTAAFDPTTKGLMANMINAFNSTLQAGLAGKPGVVMIDAFTQGRDQIANSAQYSLSNVTDPACSKTSPANPLKGNSLTCTPNSTNAGDTSKYLFADDVHLTPFGYQLLAQFVTFKLIAAGWL
jgi:outer membrane lipase/esterase